LAENAEFCKSPASGSLLERPFRVLLQLRRPMPLNERLVLLVLVVVYGNTKFDKDELLL
jgi:hypothetical protein